MIDICVEFLVEWGTLSGTELLSMIFDQFHNVLDTLDEEVVLVISLGFLFGDQQVRLITFDPLISDIFQKVFDFQLLVGVISEFQDHADVIQEVEAHNFFEGEIFACLVEVFFDFNSELFPMSISDR